MFSDTQNDPTLYEIEAIDGRPLDAYGYQTGKKWTADLAGEVASKLVGQVIDWSKFRPESDVDAGIDVQYVLKASDGTTLSGTARGGADTSDPYNNHLGERRDPSFWALFPLRIAPESVFSFEPSRGGKGFDIYVTDVESGHKEMKYDFHQGGFYAPFEEAWQAEEVVETLNTIALVITPTDREIHGEIFDYSFGLCLGQKYPSRTAGLVEAEVNEGPEL